MDTLRVKSNIVAPSWLHRRDKLQRNMHLEGLLKRLCSKEGPRNYLKHSIMRLETMHRATYWYMRQLNFSPPCADANAGLPLWLSCSSQRSYSERGADRLHLLYAFPFLAGQVGLLLRLLVLGVRTLILFLRLDVTPLHPQAAEDDNASQDKGHDEIHA